VVGNPAPTAPQLWVYKDDKFHPARVRFADDKGVTWDELVYASRRREVARVVSERVKDGNRIEVDFRDIDVGQAPAGSRFRVEEPKDFEVSIEPLSPVTP
jgi:hypothetical protein